MLNKFYFLAIISLCFIGFSSCNKEDIDLTTTEEDENLVTVLECDGFAVELIETDGTITLEVIEGTAPYIYLWSTNENSESITVNESGVYSVSITDAIGCDITGEISVELETDDCSGFALNIAHDGSGQLTANLAGGNAPFFYQWSTGDNTEELLVTEDGVYSLTVTDAIGCVVIEEVNVILNSGDCNNTLSLLADTNPVINFSATSEAYLWKASCSDFGSQIPQFDHNYLILDVNWNGWGTNQDPSYLSISDGVPGITIGSNGMPQVGDVLSPYFVGDDYFYDESASKNYDLDEIEIEITEANDVVGGQIGGIITGTIVDQNDPDNSSTVTGMFCVTIVSVCE